EHIGWCPRARVGAANHAAREAALSIYPWRKRHRGFGRAIPGGESSMSDTRIESDSLGQVEVPATALWGAQTQRSLRHFSIGQDLIPREMIPAYAILKRSAAVANRAGGHLDDQACDLITRVCDEIIAGQHLDMFPLHVWMTGSGTQFNMNVNEVISNR